MTDGELRRMIRDIIRQELTTISMAFVNSNQSNQRSTIQRFKNDGPIPNIRSIQPFGISSRAPKDTDAVVAGVGGDVTHLIMLGHFDKSKPTGQDGETLLYDAFGHVVYLSQDKLQFGSKSSENPMMLGDLVQDFLSQLLEKIAEHTHPAPGYPPTNAAEFTALKASPVDDGTLVSDKAFTEK